MTWKTSLRSRRQDVERNAFLESPAQKKMRECQLLWAPNPAWIGSWVQGCELNNKPLADEETTQSETNADEERLPNVQKQTLPLSSVAALFLRSRGDNEGTPARSGTDPASHPVAHGLQIFRSCVRQPQPGHFLDASAERLHFHGPGG